MSHNNLQKLIATMLTLMLISIAHTTAQDTPVISISLPLHQDRIPDEAFADFEAEYGVQVHVISNPTGIYLSSPAENTQAHLNELRAYTESADVLYVNNYTLTGIGANTGFFLDLNPLASTDANLNPADFHPVAWQAFRHDGRMMALPISFNTIVTGYNPVAFDAVNLNYPTPNWTIEDFAFAARTLTQYDANGRVTQAGYESSFFDTHLIHAFVGQSLLNTNQFPPVFDTSNPQLSYVLNVWNQLRAEGVIGQGDNMANAVSTMTLFSSSYFNGSSASGALLPGNHAGLDMAAYAISSGTQYPELAFALARSLTENPAIVSGNFQTYAARTSIPMQHAVPQQVEAVLSESLLLSIPYHEMRYADYLQTAMDTADVPGALQTIHVNLSQALQTAQQFGAESTIAVTSAPASGDGIVLNFGVATTILPLPDQEQWNLAISEFVAQDTVVGAIQLEGAFASPKDYPTDYDCFVLPVDAIHTLDRASLLRIDPMLMSDTDFNPDDFVATVFDSVDDNGQVYAYPLSIAPRLLAVDTILIDNTGASIPQRGWSIEQFTDTLIQWQEMAGSPAYMLDDALDVLTLVVAYGGLPLDYSTSPPTADFTSAETVEALRQVLDFARNGLVEYRSMVDIAPMGTASPASPIRNIYLTPSGAGVVSEQSHYVNFPAGRDYNLASYRIIAGAISSQTQHAEACYRWLSFISRQSYIFQSMPVLQAVLEATQNPDFIRYAGILQAPDVINVPYVNKVGSDDTFVLHYILNRAMDAYVLAGADLDTELQSAQTNADLYTQCRQGGDSVQNCALAIVPDIQTMLR